MATKLSIPNLYINASLVPSVDMAFDLGSSGSQWLTLHSVSGGGGGGGGETGTTGETGATG